jgi:hypothetical protein
MEEIQAEERANAPAANPAAVILEAIVKQQAVAATYNRVEVTLAPHILYTKHDELHVDAVTLDRDSKPPKEVKLGVFRLSGLGGLRLTPRRFEKSRLFAAGDPRYDGTTLMAIDPAA